MSSLREISMKEVKLHDSYNDMWIVLFNRVYNITPFLDKHPGGYEIILEHAGRDASFVFMGAGHANVSLSMIENYLMGILPESEHINAHFPAWIRRIEEFKQIA